MNKLFVVIAFHYVESRIKYLNGVLSSLSNFGDDYKVHVVIQTNDAQKPLQNLVDGLSDITVEIEEIKILKDPFMLTWCHKCRMYDFLDDDSYTHFVYLEDDMELTKDNMEYWLRTKKIFKDKSLKFIPAFVRVEYKDSGEAMAIDMKQAPQGVKVQINDVGNFASFDQYYQGMFIMDRDMVAEHVESPSFKFETSRPIPFTTNDVRERANQGNMYLNVIQGFNHMMLVPITDEKYFWIEHNAGNYIPMENTLHGKFPISKLFENF